MNKKERETFLKLFRRMNTTEKKKINELKDAREKKDTNQSLEIRASLRTLRMCIKGLTDTLDETGNPISTLIGEFKQ